MSKVEDDKKHIIETMDRDIELANEIKELSKETLVKLSFALNKFANDKQKGDVINAYVLNQTPDTKQRKILNDLIDEFNGDDSEEVIAMVNGAGKSYKNSNSAYLLSVITVVCAGLLAKTNKVMQKYDEDEQNAEISYQTGKNGDLNGILSAKNANEVYSGVFEQSDDDLGSLNSANYQATTDLISSVYAQTVDKIKQNPNTNEFAALITSATLLKVIVNKNDVANAKSRLINKNINGFFDKYDARVVRNYRTQSAKADSEFKRSIAKKYHIKEAIIINELGACKHCMERIGRVYDYNSACDMVPQHYCCRCEVKLLIFGSRDDADDD